MDKRATEQLRMWLVIERATALLVTDAPMRDTRKVWIPRSLVGDLRKEPPQDPLCYAPILFTLPAWKIEELSLWDFVTG